MKPAFIEVTVQMTLHLSISAFFNPGKLQITLAKKRTNVPSITTVFR